MWWLEMFRETSKKNTVAVLLKNIDGKKVMREVESLLEEWMRNQRLTVRDMDTLFINPYLIEEQMISGNHPYEELTLAPLVAKAKNPRDKSWDLNLQPLIDAQLKIDANMENFAKITQELT